MNDRDFIKYPTMNTILGERLQIEVSKRIPDLAEESLDNILTSMLKDIDKHVATEKTRIFDESRNIKVRLEKLLPQYYDIPLIVSMEDLMDDDTTTGVVKLIKQLSISINYSIVSGDTYCDRKHEIYSTRFEDTESISIIDEEINRAIDAISKTILELKNDIPRNCKSYTFVAGIGKIYQCNCGEFYIGDVCPVCETEPNAD